ncbi:Ig-like domain-containing protein [Rubellicoccus peritrichatus]|uniref:Ig-like domain-containing protein n=1 Tax=Rubellicoccus peritrichatus TaxID=3080537 RepID=A0AAQ3QWH0_9BACT|nr:Ig-like domain-containing protein [Puniceicoccus sp. CR14]WOO41882.1 Ig-like domain-containing protein [Puniceicoccus sp. CR14]
MKLLQSLQLNRLRRCSLAHVFSGALLSFIAAGSLHATAPFVSLTAPYPSGNLGQFLLGSDIVCTAVARDIDGSDIVNYEFSVDGTVVQTGTQSFYVYPAITEGNPAISVTVTDGDGETATSNLGGLTVANRGFIPSLVELDTPLTGSSISLNTVISAAGSVDSAGEALGGLIFLRNGTFVSETVSPTASTFSFTDSSSEDGTFSYFVLSHYARDVTEGPADNRVTVTWTMANISNISTVQVSDTNVIVSSPINGTQVKLNSPFQILATATSGNSSIEQVQFFINDTLIETDNLYPFQASYTPTTSGDLVVKVEATDSRGDTSTNSVTVTPEIIGGEAIITSPVNGFQFSVFEDVTIEATINPLNNNINKATFLANGAEISILTDPPYEVVFNTTVPGDFVFVVNVEYDDGTLFSSPGVATQAVFNPLSNNADFVTQSFLDFFGDTPNDVIRDDFVDQLDTGKLTRTEFLSELIGQSSQGGDGTSVVGAYSTVLRRFPSTAEFQAAMLSLNTGGGGGSGTDNIPISIGDTVSGTLDTIGEIDTYEFTVSGTQLITASITSPLFVQLTFRTETGGLIASSGNGFFVINPELAATLNGTATFLLDVDGIGTGAYTLSLFGPDDAGSGVTGSLVLTTLLNNLYDSAEYLFQFGPVPDVIGNDFAIILNRQNLVDQLYFSKYGAGPSQLQKEQGAIRMANLGGFINYTEIFITEETFDDGSDLLIDTFSQRPYWQTGFLVIGMFNEQPTNATIREFTDQDLNSQLQEMQDDPRYLDRFPPIQSVLLGGEADDDGWVNSPWLSFTNLRQDPWYYHFTLSWLFTSSLSPEAVWFYSPVLGWFFTNDQDYPFLYSDTYKAWLFYYEGTSNPSWFYNTSTDEAFSLDLE